LGRDGRPSVVPVTLGITDGAYTEVVRGEVQQGQALLVGLDIGPATPAPPTVVGPPRL
jgi:HlyD family secretion protein